MSYNAAEELSNFIFQSKYSKFIPDLNRKETFEESIERIDSMHTEHLFNNYPNAFKNSEFANDYIECIEAYKENEKKLDELEVKYEETVTDLRLK